MDKIATQTWWNISPWSVETFLLKVGWPSSVSKKAGWRRSMGGKALLIDTKATGRHRLGARHGFKRDLVQSSIILFLCKWRYSLTYSTYLWNLLRGRSFLCAEGKWGAKESSLGAKVLSAVASGGNTAMMTLARPEFRLPFCLISGKNYYLTSAEARQAVLSGPYNLLWTWVSYLTSFKPV